MSEPSRDSVDYVDFGVDEAFTLNPIEKLMPLVREHHIVNGFSATFDGVTISNHFMLPDGEHGQFLALSFSAVKTILADSKNFSSKQAFSYSVGKGLGQMLFNSDAPEHTRYRALVMNAFMHRSVTENWLNERIRPVIEEKFATFVRSGKGDLVNEFTLHFPYLVIAKIIGLPNHHANVISNAFIAAMRMALDPVEGMKGFEKMNQIFSPIVKAARKAPKDDFIGALVRAEDEAGRLSDEEILMFLRNLALAGLDTTARATANLLYHLLSNREQLERLRQDRTLLDTAIWEGIRMDPPGLIVPRVATSDVEIEGTLIPKGSGVILCMGTANYDERIWEDPFTFDITRKRQPIMSFGYGAHTCIGSSLSLIEMRIAMNLILDSMQNLRPDPERWHEAELVGFGLRSPTALPVLWDYKELSAESEL